MFLVAALRLTQDADEPSSICDSIPFLTPIIKMATHGVAFHERMRDLYKLPIFTLRMPGTRLYVINSPSLLAPVQSQFRALSFPAIEANIAANVIGVNKATNAIVGHHVNQDDGYLMNFPKYVHSALSAGPGLDAMNRRSVQVIAKSLNEHAQRGVSAVSMFKWIRHELLLATTEGVYGPNNPFRDPVMEEAWYAFEPGIMVFVMNLFPRWFASKSFKAREYMVKVWERYFDEGSYEHGSELIKARTRINNDFNIALMETARIEVGGTQAILSNTLPGAFWLAWHIFSNPVVLKDVREELSKGVYVDDKGISTIDLLHVKILCPILLSALKETMRLRSSATATRVVMEDHLLHDRYLLKKGGTVMMPSAVQHSNRDMCGHNVDEFLHKRFVRQLGVKGVNPIAFRGFGCGTTLCPGRHFSSTEIMMFSALLVLRFDLRPAGSLKKWVEPPTTKSPMTNAMPVPDWDLDVNLCPRDDGTPWNVSFTGCDTGMEIAAEDVKGATPDLGH